MAEHNCFTDIYNYIISIFTTEDNNQQKYKKTNQNTTVYHRVSIILDVPKNSIYNTVNRFFPQKNINIRLNNHPIDTAYIYKDAKIYTTLRKGIL